MRNRTITILFLALLATINAIIIIADSYATARGLRFLCFLGAGLGDGVAALFGVLSLRRMSASKEASVATIRFLQFQVGALAGIVADDVGSLLATALYPSPAMIRPLGYGLLFWSGRLAKTFGIVLMVLYQMNILNGGKSLDLSGTSGASMKEGAL